MDVTESDDWDYSDSVNGAYAAHEEKLAVARLERGWQHRARRFGFTLRCPGRRRTQYQLVGADGIVLTDFDSVDQASNAILAAAKRRWEGR